MNTWLVYSAIPHTKWTHCALHIHTTSDDDDDGDDDDDDDDNDDDDDGHDDDVRLYNASHSMFIGLNTV